MDAAKVVITRSPEETVELADRVVRCLDAGDFIALSGDLGSGKTMFVKGLARGLGVMEYSYVNSPSFVIMKEYAGEKPLYHFDVYRLSPESFSETLDHERYFYGGGITVVEWADKIRDILPERYLEVRIEYGSGEEERRFTFRAVGGGFGEI